MRRQYRVLAALSALLTVLGVVAILGGIGLAVYVVYIGVSANVAPVTSTLVNGAVFLVGGLVGGLLLWGLGQLLRLLMDMAANVRQTEINTRMTAKLLQRQLSRPAPSPIAPQAAMPRSRAADLDEEPFSFIG